MTRLKIRFKEVLKPKSLQEISNNYFQCLPCRDYHNTNSDISENGLSAVKQFEEIPGPKSLPLIGTLLNYIPFFGDYKFDRLHHNGMKKLERYGPLVKEEIVPGTSVVWVFDPTDIETVFRSEGRYPERRSHLAVQKYRQDRPHVYSTGGLLPTNGPEWGRLRTIFQRSLSRPQNVKHYIAATDAVMQDFVQLIRKRSKSSQELHDYLPDLSHLFMELIGQVAFDVSLGSLSEDGLKPDSLPSLLIEAAETTNSCIVKLDNGLQLWRWMETPLYKKLKKAHQIMESAAVEFVSQKAETLKDFKGSPTGKQSSLLEQFLVSPELSYKDVVGMAVDMILAGMDTTSFSSSFALYHLAMNETCQQTLQEEARRLLPNHDSPVTSELLSQAAYTKAVLKETFRLNPISVGIGRILAQDAVLSGYHVPAGTVVVTQNQVSCQLPQYFPQPKCFLPERWLKGHTANRPVSPYLVLPFGHGPRACIARRLAEQNLQILILKVARNFKIGWKGESLDVKSLPVNKPDVPIYLTFSEL